MTFKRPKHDYELHKLGQEPRLFRRGKFLIRKDIPELTPRHEFMEELCGWVKLVFLGADAGFIYGSEEEGVYIVYHPSSETVRPRPGESIPPGNPYHDSFYMVHEHEGGLIRRVSKGSCDEREPTEEGEEEEAREGTVPVQPAQAFYNPLLD